MRANHPASRIAQQFLPLLQGQPRLSKMELHLGRHYHDITQFIFAYKLINYTNATRCTAHRLRQCVCVGVRACEPVPVGVMHALHGG